MDEIQVHRTYLTQLTKLRAWYVWWLLRKSDLGFSQIIEKRVDLLMREVATNRPDADPTEDCRHRYGEQDDNPDTTRLEKWMVHQLKQGIERAASAYAAGLTRPRPPDHNGFSCRCEKSYFPEYERNVLTLHFRNAFAPDSPFDDRDRLVTGLSQAVREAVHDHPGVTRIECQSWLNKFPPFADLFPRAWRQGAVIEHPSISIAWWGQFTDRTGGFHHRNAAALRATGRFPYRCMRCTCSVQALACFHQDDPACGRDQML